MQRFEDVHERFTKGRLSAAEAAEWLGVSERTFRRQRTRFEEEGLSGLLDRRLGKASPHRVPADETARVLELYRTRYTGWTVKHFHERLVERHGLTRSYGWTKSVLHAAGLVRPAVKRSAHRKKRPRRPVPGMMLHQDGSQHLWLPALGRVVDLIVTLDDATSEIYSAFFVEEEGTASSFQGLLEVFQAKGLPCTLYTDRGSHYFHTPAAGGKVDKDTPTQVGRALDQLGVEHIPAYSPEARGRSERMFGTLQGRLVNELADAGITTLEAANRFLAADYLPRHNARFMVEAGEPGSAFVPLRGVDLAEILCHQEDRVVARDNTVRFDGLVLQIPPSPWRAHFVKSTVRVHRYPDGRLALFYGPRCIARYDAAGTLQEDAIPQAA
ncbi:ISNCY family transposase [Azospirillum sp. RWY-5-1]|uniref:ISNCY family transposase n=2 Tax=Azospirillum oleiclasticum TaxID=2735135 RepID=A0ABX2TIT2_9PROT|nr:ISNCY family transposase [Azospirillum oleiclasticum]NYZ23665.1 ISNCY family transposase [Azospirillum oleiclasticum]